MSYDAGGGVYKWYSGYEFDVGPALLADATCNYQVASLGSVFAGTRAEEQFGLFERWRMNSLKLEFRPFLSTSEPGTVSMAPDYDPADNDMSKQFDNNPDVVDSILASMPGYTQAPIYAPLTMTMSNKRMQDGSWLVPTLFTDQGQQTYTIRDVNFGKIYILVDPTKLTQPTAAGQKEKVGTFLVKYSLTFMVNQHPTIAINGTNIDTTHIAFKAPLAEITLADPLAISSAPVTSLGGTGYGPLQTGQTAASVIVDTGTSAPYPFDSRYTYLAQYSNVYGSLTGPDGVPLTEGIRLFLRTTKRIFDPATSLWVWSDMQNADVHQLSLDFDGNLPVYYDTTVASVDTGLLRLWRVTSAGEYLFSSFVPARSYP
jgi:hypothetical protein